MENVLSILPVSPYLSASHCKFIDWYDKFMEICLLVIQTGKSIKYFSGKLIKTNYHIAYIKHIYVHNILYTESIYTAVYSLSCIIRSTWNSIQENTLF